MSQAERAARFAELHVPGTPLLMPNPWDVGSAVALAAVGFEALATTSSGFAGSLGRIDGAVSRDEAIAHAAALVAAVDVPVSADLENCFGDDPDDVADTVRRALGAGLAGCSVEDYTQDDGGSVYPFELAVARVAAAVEVAHGDPVHLVITARAENHIRGRDDLADTISRLQAFQEAGADVLFAPGVNALDDIRRLVESVDRPVNVIGAGSAPSVTELASVGVARISVGGSFFYAAMGALADAANELRDAGTYAGPAANIKSGRVLARRAFSSGP